MNRQTLTIKNRIQSYNAGRFGRLYFNCGRIDGTWIIGNTYRNESRYYGAFPRSFVERVGLLFPDIPGGKILHLFSGSLKNIKGVRIDIDPSTQPDIVADASRLDKLPPNLLKKLVGLRMCVADPPYSRQDALHYTGAYPDKKRVFSSLFQTCPSIEFVIWLDTCWPMHRKAEWKWIGHIQLIRSTNHRVRTVSIFQRE